MPDSQPYTVDPSALTSKSLEDVFSDSITVRHVAEPLTSCDQRDLLQTVSERMRQLGFDVLGVRSGDGVIGYIAQGDHRKGAVGQYLTLFHPKELIADSTPVVELLRRLRAAQRVFVLSKAGVTGIVTRGDLQKAPIRAYVFGLITLFEMTLTERIRQQYDSQEWIRWLSEGRLIKAKKLLELRKARNEQLDLLECLQLADKERLTLKSSLFALLSYASRAEALRSFDQLDRLRNRLAHGHDLVAGSSWEDVIDTVTHVKGLIDRLEAASDSDAAGAPVDAASIAEAP